MKVRVSARVEGTEVGTHTVAFIRKAASSVAAAEVPSADLRDESNGGGEASDELAGADDRAFNELYASSDGGRREEGVDGEQGGTERSAEDGADGDGGDGGDGGNGGADGVAEAVLDGSSPSAMAHSAKGKRSALKGKAKSPRKGNKSQREGIKSQREAPPGSEASNTGKKKKKKAKGK